MKQPEPAGPFILAIETATMIGSVAIFSGENLLGLTEIRRAKSHAKLLMPMIKELLENLDLKPADLDAIAVAKGPGSYTGLRVGVSTAKGLCMALDKALLSISSLEGLARQVHQQATQLQAWICPMIDARRMEVYCAFFDEEMKEVMPIQAHIVEQDSFKEILDQRKVIFVGDGVKKCVDIFKSHPHAILLPDLLSSARGMGQPIFQQYTSGSFENLTTFEPFYLKDFRATKPRNRLLD